MNTEIKIFENPQFGKVRIMEDESGKPLFAASDVAVALGYENPVKAINDHCKGVTKRYTLLKSGLNGGMMREAEVNVIPEKDVYRLIMRSKLPEAEVFQDWVVEEVLPSIRKHGGYLTPQKVQEALLNPDTLIQLATNLKNEQQKRLEAEQSLKVAQKQNEQLSSKAEYVDTVLQSTTSYTLTTVAHDLGLRSVHVLTKILKDAGILYYQSGIYQPSAKYADKGYFTFKTFTKNSEDNTVMSFKSLSVTERGCAFLHSFIKEQAQNVVFIANGMGMKVENVLF